MFHFAGFWITHVLTFLFNKRLQSLQISALPDALCLSSLVADGNIPAFIGELQWEEFK